MDSMQLYREVMALQDKAGVPLDTRWRSLLLYLREVKDYTHLSDIQKMDIQTMMASIYSSRDYSEENLRRVLNDYRDCVVGQYKKKMDPLVSEAVGLIREFQKILSERRGDINSLEETALGIIEKSLDSPEQMDRLREAFSRIKDFFVHDLRTLENMAVRDALTGLSNRGAFDDFMASAVEDWKNSGRPLGLTMFDVDNFKKFNDTHGHRIGDQVLALVAKQVRMAADDVPPGNRLLTARYGGEEMALAISGKGVSLLPKISENIRRNIRLFNFLIRDTDGNVLESGVHITVSAGIAAMSGAWTGMYLENLIDCADKALYYAKHHGRDKTVMFRHNEKQSFVVVTPTD
ncbi:MAG: GGDEF domain-containing protein [Desulfovibrio sp.]|jgi:diguanylate cyclase (GGDEF)-like protein|nr:GGDEF domain-containing protein [Desulfovibrio sp.]